MCIRGAAPNCLNDFVDALQSGEPFRMTRLLVSAFVFRCPAQSKGAPMNIRHIPASVAAPFGPYSHAVEVPEGSRLLYISGEVGVLPDGTVPETIEAQAEACWQNIIAILADAEMGVQDLVKITTYLVNPEDVAAAGGARPGSATIIVTALVNP